MTCLWRKLVAHLFFFFEWQNCISIGPKLSPDFFIDVSFHVSFYIKFGYMGCCDFSSNNLQNTCLVTCLLTWNVTFWVKYSIKKSGVFWTHPMWLGHNQTFWKQFKMWNVQSGPSISTQLKGCGSTQDIIDGPDCMSFDWNISENKDGKKIEGSYWSCVTNSEFHFIM